MQEQYTNDAATTLDGGIDNSQTTIDVVAFAGFPANPQFRIRIDDEILLVTAGAGSTTWTVTRGAEGTAAASHANAAPVTHIFTSGAIDQLRIDDFGADSIANRPAAGKQGRIFIPNDGTIIQRDDGANWVSFGPLMRLKQPPALSNFAWVNQAAATAADQGGTVVISKAQQGSGVNELSILKKSAPATPYVITAAFTMFSGGPIQSSTERPGFGLLFRQSSDGKLESLHQYTLNGVPQIEVPQWTDANTYSGASALATGQNGWWGPINWLRIEDDGTNRKHHVSPDGINWTRIHQLGRTSFLTANEVGWYFTNRGSAGSGDKIGYVRLLSWEEN